MSLKGSTAGNWPSLKPQPPPLRGESKHSSQKYQHTCRRLSAECRALSFYSQRGKYFNRGTRFISAHKAPIAGLFFFFLHFDFFLSQKEKKRDFSSSLATQITYLRIYEEFLYSDSRDFHLKFFFIQKNSRNYILATANKLGVLLPSCVEIAHTVKRTVTLPHSSRHLNPTNTIIDAELFIDPHVYLQCVEVPIQLGALPAA